MEAIATGLVLKTAKRMGFSRDSEATLRAIEVAVLAVRDGRSVELAVELGESELARSMQFSAA